MQATGGLCVAALFHGETRVYSDMAQTLDRFPTDEWTAGSSRPLVIVLIAFVTITPWLVIFLLTNQPGGSLAVGAAIVDWTMTRYLSMSRDFGWLLPLLFSFVIASGIWTRFGGILTLRDRRDLNVRTFTSVIVGSIGVQLGIFAVCAWSRRLASESSTSAVLIATGLLLVVTIEIARVQPLIPLTEQIANARRNERAWRTQLSTWSQSDRELRTWAAPLVIHAVGVIGLSVLFGFRDGLDGVSRSYELPFTAGMLVTALFLSGTTFIVSSSRVETTAEDSIRSRAARGATLAFTWTMWASIALVLLLAGLQFALVGQYVRGTALAIMVIAVSLSGLWTGSPSKLSVVASRSLGGLIRVRACQGMQKKADRERMRRKRLKKELARRRAVGSRPGA